VLTGAAPFGEGSAVEVAARRLTTSLPRVSELVPGIPPDLEEIIDWATRIDPRERPSDGTELASALRALAADDAATAVAARVARVPQRNTTPVTSDRIAPIAPAPADTADRAGSAAASAAGRAAGAAAPPEADHAATRAIPVTGGRSPAATPPVAATTAASRDATSALDADGTATDGTAVDGPVIDGSTDAGSGPSHPRRWVLGAVAAVAILLVAIGLTGGEDEAGEPGDAAAPTEDADPDADDGAEPLAIADAGDLDPDGDLREHPQDVPNAFDGDPETHWQTETYRSSDFSGLPKAGVGIWLELEEPAPLDRVEVELSTEGGTLELWASPEGPPADEQLPEDWGTRLGGGEVPAARMQFPDLPDSEVRTVVLWFTDLPEGGRGWRGEIREVRLIGR
jgi:hypothetical protein